MPKQLARTPARRVWTVVLAVLAIVAVAAGALLAVPSWRATVLPSTTVTMLAAAPQGYRAPATASPPALPLEAVTDTPAPTAKALLGRLAKLPEAAAGKTSMVVIDPQTGRTLIDRGDRPAMPASTMKLLSSVAALEALGDGRTFATTTVTPRDGVVILRGGGDPLLSDRRATGRASLQNLAAATATALKRAGVTKVTLGYDTTLFSGGSWHRHWTDNYRYSVAPITALTVDGGRTRTGEADRNSSRTAAKKFAARLAKAGIAVTATTSMKAPDSARQLAAVQSPRVEELIAYALTNSDNTAIETLARQAALVAGRSGDFAGASRTVRATLQRLGLWDAGMAIDDTCGLSRENRVTAGVLARTMRLVLTEGRLRSLLAGLPVGGVSGTLADRFDDARERAGRGVVRAKTGSLRDVITLAGYLVTSDGAPLAFALMANEVRRADTVRDWMDTSTARWAACGCG
ncbi:MAG: D-alanyl-D-alanine carboxypeptidase/D-alanyl-D-alanine-endopeptidase [Micropruina sp.]|uniref:D-alanyl-D-alanine carboxypeptidase/D-alanyl-D-alanine endopeptidase n=1 Tax=Micropruina sp. TaxID=2737536 RepID=UPI0039E5FAEB